MEGQSTMPHDTDHGEGALPHLRRVFASLSSYFGARLELIALEGKEAFVHYLKLLALVAGAAVLLVFGYFFFGFGIVLLVAKWTGLDVGWIALIAFALHLMGAVACLFVAKNLLKVSQFEVTLDEIKKDQIWLR